MQLGILVDDLDYSEQSFVLLHQVYKMCNDIKHTPIIFQKRSIAPYLIPICSVLNTTELFSFSGVVLCTTLENLRILKNVAKQASDIIYYMYDLEWLRKEKNYLQNYTLLKDVKIIVQNNFHHNALVNYCGFQPFACIPNLDLNMIAGLYE